MSSTVLIGKKLVDRDGSFIGTIDDIVVDPGTSIEEWVRVRFGMLRDRTLVPMHDVRPNPRQPAMCTRTKRQVRDAPPVHDHALDAITRHELLRHYGIDDPA